MSRHRLPVCIAVAIALFVPGLLPAAEAPIRSALDIVPADAAFFAAWSRQGEQFDILRESRAFEQFMEIPRVREALGPLILGEFDLDNPNHVTMKQWLSQPFVQAGIDAISQEVFVYGDASITAFVNHYRDMVWGSREDRLEALATGKMGHYAGLAADAAFIRGLPGLDLPGLAFGFKVKDSMRARVQLMLLDGLIHLAMAGQDVSPAVRKQYGRETIQGQQFLTFTITGSMVLDQIEFESPPKVQPEALAAFIKAFRQQKVVLAVGFLNDYVILSVGGTTDHLHRLGQEESLAGHPDLARVEELGDKPRTSVRYVASDYRTAINAYAGGRDDLDDLFEQSLADGAVLSDETRGKAENALKTLRDEKKREQEREPRPASLAFSYMTDTGYEGFSFDESRLGPHPAGSMSVLLHTGADPIGVFAQRHWIDTLEDYDRFSEQVAKALGQLEKWLSLEEEEELFARDQFRILAVQFDTIMRQQVVPALAGGQAALVISATDRSRQWHTEIPVAKESLPLPELALVVETEDPLALLEGIDEAYQVLKAAIRLVSDTIHEIPPLEPQIEDTAMGRLYFLPMWPELTRIDPDLLAPTAGLSDRWLVVALRPKTATTLLRPTGWTPPDIAEDDHLTLMSLSHIRPERLTQIILDWVGYVEETLTETPSEDDAALLTVYRGALQLVGCLKSYTRSVRRDGDTSVTHTVWRFEDRP
jgi:hypothetical protein